MSDKTPPFRADHVRSLLRPPDVLVARERFAASEIDAAELRGIEDALTMEGNDLTQGQQAAKLRLVVETVEEVEG